MARSMGRRPAAMAMVGVLSMLAALVMLASPVVGGQVADEDTGGAPCDHAAPTDGRNAPQAICDKVTPGPTEKPTGEVKPTAEVKPTEKPEKPTESPTEAPTATPTEAPTATPTEAPTATPTEAPTVTPTPEEFTSPRQPTPTPEVPGETQPERPPVRQLARTGSEAGMMTVVAVSLLIGGAMLALAGVALGRKSA